MKLVRFSHNGRLEPIAATISVVVGLRSLSVNAPIAILVSTGLSVIEAAAVVSLCDRSNYEQGIARKVKPVPGTLR